MATLTTTIKERVRLALADKAAGDVINAILALLDDGTGSITVGAITGGDASLGITGQAAASATAAGGAVAIAAAAGGSTSGTGGAVTATAGAGTAGNANGGANTATAGAAHGTGTGGAASLIAGASGAGATGTGGTAAVTGGASAATNGKGGDVVLTPGASSGTGALGIIRASGVIGRSLSRATISNGGTITDAQTAGGILYQDASGGSVTMTTRTGTQLAAYFSTLATGESIQLFLASNHATNTSTIAGGTDVTLVGSGAVTQTGGSFLLVKTAATTFDLVRVG